MALDEEEPLQRLKRGIAEEETVLGRAGLPKRPPDKHDAVIRLRLDGPPRAVSGDWMR